MSQQIRLADTLGNEQWLRENEAKVKALFPDTWTHMENLNGMQIGFQFKLLGIDWRNEQEFGRCMVYLEKLGFLQRQNGLQVRANPSTIFR